MRPRTVLALALALAVVGTACAAIAGHHSEQLDWRQGGVATTGPLSLRYPSGWYGVSDYGSLLVVASFPVTREWLDAERRSLPSQTVFIQAFTYGRLPPSYDASFPLRPARLELDPKTLGFYECNLRLEGYVLRFRDHGLAVQLEVALGRHTDPQAALAVINRLRVA